MVERPEPSLPERAGALASWALGGTAFLTVGWLVMKPDDPVGPVSALARRDGLMMLVQAGLIAGVTAGLATLMAGRRLADAGTFAAALGLALVSLRGGTAEHFLVQGADVSRSFEHGLARTFALEALGWIAVIILTIGVSAVVIRWCFGRRAGSGAALEGSLSAAHTGDLSQMAAPLPAGFDGLGVSVRLFGVSAGAQTAAADGIRHMLIAAGVGLAMITLLSAGLSFRSIQHGQVCFVVAAAVCIGTYVGYRFVPVRSVLWSILAVGLVALVGYLWGALRPAAVGLPPSIPSAHVMRILPIQLISVGTAAAVATFEYVYVPVLDPGRGHGHGGRTTKRGDTR